MHVRNISASVTPLLIVSLSPSWSGTPAASQAGLAMQSFCHSLLSAVVIYVSHSSFQSLPHLFSLAPRLAWVAEDDLELLTLLPPPPDDWDFGCAHHHR